MAELLRITTPLVSKNYVQPNKQPTDPSTAFNIGDVTKVVRTSNQSELKGQHNGLIGQEDAPSILMNLLRDPAVTVNYLKNIYMLQEIIKLLPVNNNPMTQEIQQLFNALLINPGDMVDEMLNQEQSSTVFKGELFDFLRQILANNPSNEVKYGIAGLLKSINGILGKADVVDSIANGLQFLCEQVESSKTLSKQLADLVQALRRPDAAQNFPALKQETLALLKSVEQSILYSPKMEKMVSIITYNLSRFQESSTFLQETTENLLRLIDGRPDKEEFIRQMKTFLGELSLPEKQQSSKVMNILSQIIGKQVEAQSSTTLNSEKVEKIIYSLLSSPCNFTPLLHFVIPVDYMDLKSFAEIWIDQNKSGEQGQEGESQRDNIHMLVVFDIQGIGEFEAEVFVVDNTLALSLFCPETYLDYFTDMGKRLAKIVEQSPYQMGNVSIEKLGNPRSLMDVFKSLPYRRTGVDVKV